jgi:hypothetical protein
VLDQLVDRAVAAAQLLVQVALALLVRVLLVDLELNKPLVTQVVVVVVVPAALVAVVVATIMALMEEEQV